MATQTISQRIALEGADEILRALREIGAQGSAAFKQVEQAAIQASGNLGRFVGQVARVEAAFISLRTSAAAFGASVGAVASGFNRLDSAFSKTLRNASLLTLGLGGVVLAIGKLASGVGAASDEIDEQAAGLGISAEAYQKLSIAASDAGVDSQKFARGLNNLNKVLAEQAGPQLAAAQKELQKLGLRFADTPAGAKAAADAIAKLTGETDKLKKAAELARRAGLNIRFAPSVEGVKEAEKLIDRLQGRFGDLGKDTDKAGAALRRLGVSAFDPLTGKAKTADRALLEIAEAFTRIQDPAEKTRLAAALFGELMGRRFVDLLNKGAGGINKIGDSLGKLIIPKDQIEAAATFQTALTVLGAAAKSAREQLFNLFAGRLTPLAEAMTSAILRNFDNLKSGLENVIKTQIEPIIQNLITLLGGAGGAEDESQLEVIDLWTARFVAFRDAVLATVSAVAGAFRLLLSAAEEVAKVFNNIFGTNFTGATLLATAVVLKFLGVFGLLAATLRVVGGVFLLVVRGVGLLIAAFKALGAAAGLLRFIPLLFAGLVSLPVLIVAAVAAAGVAIVVFWDEIKAGAAATWEFVKQAFAAGWAFIKTGWEGLTGAASAVWQAIQAGVSALWDGIKATFAAGWEFITAGWEALKAAPQAVWDAIVAIVEGAWNRIRAFISSAAAGLGTVWDGAKTGAQSAWDGIAAGASALAGRIGGALSTAVSIITAPFRTIVNALTQTFNNVVTSAQNLTSQIQAIVSAGLDISQGVDVAAKLVAPFASAALQIRGLFSGLRNEAVSGLVAALDGVAAAIARVGQAAVAAVVPVRQLSAAAPQGGPVAPGGSVAAPSVASLVSPFQAASDQIRSIWQQLVDFLSSSIAGIDLSTALNLDASGITGAIQEIVAQFGAIGEAASQADQAIMSFADSAVQRLKDIAQAAQDAAGAVSDIGDGAGVDGGGGGAGGFARGGLVRGGGTSTSDSILARLSKDEFVVRAAAVNHFGPQVFAALNALRVPKFSMGGLAERFSPKVPRFAAGGLADLPAPRAGGRPIALTIDSGGAKEVFNVWADEDVAEKVVRYAVSRQVASAGRRSSAFGQ
jgi:phage-related protein